MLRRTLQTLLFTLLLPAFAFAAGDGDDRNTIRPSDIPKDAPRFDAYPARPYAGANAVPDVLTDPRSRRYRTQLKNWAAEKPNFAGHFILATWGCGTGCTEIALVDAMTGKVFHPAGARSNSIADVDPEMLEEGGGPRRADFGALQYRADSRLLILIGTPEGRTENRGISYFVWENDRLSRIRFVARSAPRQ